ncbi:MAG: hypothetical protein GXP55_20910 [Deltaproteobacteria bacterium]|nr:hypothetical protein [Deltaproteobacteria bacterium]
MTRGALVLLASFALCAGCYAKHGPRRDTGANDSGLDASVDARVDAGDPACPWLGPYRPCGDGCAHEPFPYDSCRSETEFCDLNLDLCFPVVNSDPRGELGCFVGYPDPHPQPQVPPTYCWDGKPCLAGHCVDDSICRIAPEFREGMQCVYSDGTLYENGPPYPDSCPSAGDPRTPFCGGPCGECPIFDYGESSLYFDPWPQSSCIGVSETRGLGICTFYQPNGCARGSVDPLDVFGQFEIFGLGLPACLVLLDPSKPDGFEDIGTPTMASSCRAWLSRFPDAPYACLDRDWNPIP